MLGKYNSTSTWLIVVLETTTTANYFFSEILCCKTQNIPEVNVVKARLFASQNKDASVWSWNPASLHASHWNDAVLDAASRCRCSASDCGQLPLGIFHWKGICCFSNFLVHLIAEPWTSIAPRLFIFSILDTKHTTNIPPKLQWETWQAYYLAW